MFGKYAKEQYTKGFRSHLLAFSAVRCVSEIFVSFASQRVAFLKKLVFVWSYFFLWQAGKRWRPDGQRRSD
jgi:hypothetical protein